MLENNNQQETIQSNESNNEQEIIKPQENLEEIIVEVKKEINTEVDIAIKDNRDISNSYKDNLEIHEIAETTENEIGVASDMASSEIEYINQERNGEVDFKPKESESRESYINRISVVLRGMNIKFGNGVLTLNPQFSEWKYLNDEQLKEIFTNLLSISENSKFNKENNEKELEKLFFDNIISKANEQKTNFDDTGRGRPFYNKDGIGPATKLIDKRAHYCVSMFGIPQIRIDEQKKYIQSIVNGKNICLLGGGYSCQDLLDSEDFRPNSITNIDPFIDENKIDEIKKRSKVKYNCLKIDASSDNLLEELKNNNIDSPDEIWASFSVPMYLDNIEQIESLFSNICNSLKEGGKCRIYPMQISKKTLDNDPNLNSKIKNIFRNMIDTKKFNIFISSGVSGYKTLTIEKIKNNIQEG